MRQWYCVVQGQRYGPIGEDMLRQWIRDGRVTAADLIWTEGMANWVAASQVFPDLFAAGAPGAYTQPLRGLVPVPPPGGTRGMTPNSEITAQARHWLSGRWGLPMGFCVLNILILLGMSAIPYMNWLIQLILTGPLNLGAAVFFLTFTRGGQGDLGMLFIGFKNFGYALAAHLLMILFIYGWMLLGSALGIILFIVAAASDSPEVIVFAVLLLIPGVVLSILAQLSYSQTLYILADDLGVGPLEAIRRSKELMREKRGKLFCLWLRFIGWGLLCMLTCGIGLLWLWPYAATSFARFYDDLQPPPQAAQAPAQVQTPYQPRTPYQA